jgi:translocation and assembly module TamB
MSEPQPPPPAAPPPAPRPPPKEKRRPRLVLRSLWHTHFSLVLTLGLLAAAIAWLLLTTSGMNTAIDLANRFAPVRIETRGAFGAVLGEFGFDELRITAGDTVVSASGVRARLHKIGWPARLDFHHLNADSLRVAVTTDPTTPPPDDIGIPLQVTSEQVRLGKLEIAVNDGSFSLQSIDGRASAGPAGYRIDDARLALGAHTATATGELGALRPFPMTLRGRVAAQVQDKTVDASVRATGSLVELTVAGELSGAASGSFEAVVASFDEPEVRSLDLDLAGIDPRFWHPAAPRAELTVKAQLAPNAAMDRVSGQLTVTNRAPGPIDADRIPARGATARVTVDATQLRFERIVAQLPRGSADGEFSVALGDGSWQARANLAGVDPAQIHGALQPMHVDGRIQARAAAGTISVSAALEHGAPPAAALTFEGRFTPRQATIDSARLALGDGHASASGSVELGGTQRVDLKGTLDRFEPGRLVKGIDARLNGAVTVDGQLKPQPLGRLRFELADSRAWGRPLAGRGRVDVDASHRLDVDIDLAVRKARLMAKGGLGAPDRSLDLALDVPSLADLLPPQSKAKVGGSVSLTGSARGDWTAPQFSLALNGKALRWADHALAGIDAKASYAGGADGAVQVLAGASGYRNAAQPRAAVESASLAVEGILSNHAIRLQTTASRAHAALVLADGGWRDDAWRGRIREATIGPPLELRLLAPTALVAGPHGVEFGPAEIAVQHVRFDDIRFRSDDAGIATQGRFSGLQPIRLAVPVEGALTPVLPATGERPPLTLRGDWNLRVAGETVDGHLLIERSNGDLYAGRGPESALGLVDARLEARVEANRLDSILRIESGRKGGIGGHLGAWLEHSQEAGWRLAQARPWRISGAFDLPTLDWINALLSDHLRANVRLGGTLAGSVLVEGTPAEPAATGRMTGTDLRMAWVEQGVRLENGTLLAELQDDLIVLKELRFSGPPRVRPDDRRAAAAMKTERDGSVSATGQLRLRDLNGVIQVAASHLPMLQQPDRWVIASGGANIEISAAHVQVNGAFAADAGFVGLARSELPSLSSDVVVVRAGDDAEARARRVTLGFDLGIDLGPAFYLRGLGLSTRVEGALRLRSSGRGSVSAVGSIATVDGIYEGFGQRLAISRGRLNFQGAPENPGLDILALRQGLPVEVGLSITRTAADPLVRLHSDPPMADVEALSWLVLGRPPEQGGADNIALLQAAAGLLGGGEGYPARVARALGVDEISIRSGSFGIASLLPDRGVAGALRSEQASAATVAGEIVTIGKTINDALSVSYQEAIGETTRILQFNYRISDRVSAVARAGTTNALDFVYTIAFD